MDSVILARLHAKTAKRTLTEMKYAKIVKMDSSWMIRKSAKIAPLSLKSQIAEGVT